MRNLASFLKPLALVIIIFILSRFTAAEWGTGGEKSIRVQYVTGQNMPVYEYAKRNQLPSEVISGVFHIHQPSDTVRNINEFGLSDDQILKKTRAIAADYEEQHSKNPFRYTLHFILAVLFMMAIFFLLFKDKMSSFSRNSIYLLSVILFGIGFNSSPSPMGPLNDSLSLLGKMQEFLHPRLFAVLTYLLIGLLANKFMCSWVCQFGTLQDLIYRTVQGKRNTLGKPIKFSFVVSNSIRIGFITAVILVTILWAINPIDHLNPFAVFGGINLEYYGLVFIGLILISSLFIYRPWCQFFCPFGLMSWSMEKFSFYKIRVNHDKCTLCNECVEQCPTKAMEAILHEKRVVPDCFACGSCQEACPSKAIGFLHRVGR